ncbi:MAG: copper homeostasis membrane protein CopD [Xanthobacteraceae bacterium]
MIYVRAIHFAATLIAVGVVFFMVFVAAPALRAATDNKAVRALLWPRLAFIGWFSLVLAVGSGAAWFILTASAMSGTPPGELSATVLQTVLTQTHFGLAAIVRLIAAGILAATFALMLSALYRPWISAVAVLAAAAVTGGLAWTGHAIGGQGAEGIVHPIADVLHLIAAAAWVGALVPLALLLGTAGRHNALAVARAATLRFSTLGVISVGTLLATGIVNTWYLAGSIEALTGTYYGQLLLAKVALFFAMVAIAAVNRQWLTPRLMQSAGETERATFGAMSQLRRNATIEALAGGAIICIVAVLGTKAPASHADHHPAYGALPADSAFVHIHTEQAMADVMIEPGRVGTAHATVHLWDGDFEPLAARYMKVSIAPPVMGSAPTTRVAVQDSDGAWQIDGLGLTQPGNWMVTVDADLDSGSHLVLAAPIVIDPAP